MCETELRFIVFCFLYLVYSILCIPLEWESEINIRFPLCTGLCVEDKLGKWLFEFESEKAARLNASLSVTTYTTLS